jgi:hypothetical protein
MLGWQGDGGQLFGIEVVKKILHPMIIPTLRRQALQHCAFIQQYTGFSACALQSARRHH